MLCRYHMTILFADRAKALFEKNQAAADARYEHLTKLVDLYK